MANPYFLRSLGLTGFRAYLQPKTFDFSKKRCLAIFAPNGGGKSSVIDALEFIFSKDGTLERLGQRAINNQAGPVALAHNLAEEAKIAPEVVIGVVSGKDVATGSRPATGAKRPIPAIATTVSACFVVPPIIRGHALRTFVEVHTPEQRYTDVANWLQLGPLVEVQKNIRALCTQVKTAAEDEAPLRRVDSQLAKETGQAVQAWDDAAVLAYANASVLATLDATLALGTLAAGDPAYIELEARSKAEENKIGLAGLRQDALDNGAMFSMATAPDVPFDEIETAAQMGSIGLESSAESGASRIAPQSLSVNTITLSAQGLAQSLKRLREVCPQGAPMDHLDEAQAPFVPALANDEQPSASDNRGLPEPDQFVESWPSVRSVAGLWPFVVGLFAIVLALCGLKAARQRVSNAKAMDIRNSARNLDARARAQAIREERMRDDFR